MHPAPCRHKEWRSRLSREKKMSLRRSTHNPEHPRSNVDSIKNHFPRSFSQLKPTAEQADRPRSNAFRERGSQSDQCVSQNGVGALPLAAPDDSRSWRLNIDPKSPLLPLPLPCLPFISFPLFPPHHSHSSLALPVPVSYLGSPFLLLFFVFPRKYPKLVN